MRYALIITAVFAMITFGYSMIGESGAYSRNSEIENVLYHLRQGQAALPDETSRELDTIFQRNIVRWVVIRWLSLATLIAATVGSTLKSKTVMPNQQVQPTADGAVSSASRAASRADGG